LILLFLVVHGRFETLEEFDCMVSAANSFGLMVPSHFNIHSVKFRIPHFIIELLTYESFCCVRVCVCLLEDGGVDAAITIFFGKQLPERVQKYILTHFDGLLVSVIVVVILSLSLSLCVCVCVCR
jgi:O-acetyl-ADP-ribose deacetylase (regulator of RNase III)